MRSGQRIDTFECTPLFLSQRDYVTRKRAILVYLLSIVSLNKNPPYSGFEFVSVLRGSIIGMLFSI